MQKARAQERSKRMETHMCKQVVKTLKTRVSTGLFR